MAVPAAAAPAGILVVTGTGTGVGKTVVVAAVAAVAAAAGRAVAVLKPAQTGLPAGEPGDVAEVARLAGVTTALELARYPDPLAPATAARLAGLPPVTTDGVARAAGDLAGGHDLVLVEGAGGLLVRFADGAGGGVAGGAGGGVANGAAGGAGGAGGAGETLADVAAVLGAPVLVVAAAGLGTLNAAALTTEALRTRGVTCAGVVVGAWPAEPDLACRCNLVDLPRYTGVPLAGVLPAGAARLDRAAFRAAAGSWLAPRLGGWLDVARLGQVTGPSGTLAPDPPRFGTRQDKGAAR